VSVVAVENMFPELNPATFAVATPDVASRYTRPNTVNPLGLLSNGVTVIAQQYALATASNSMPAHLHEPKFAVG
jgi:hypothetical protein